MTLAERIAPGSIERAHKARVDITPTGGEFADVVVDQKIDSDWTRVFEIFGLDAAEFEVVEDTVRMSTWQQSARAKDGTRDLAQLWSYSARFKRLTAAVVPVERLKEWRKALLSIVDRAEPQQSLPAASGTYTMLVADPQLGKKGTEEAVENWKHGVRCHVQTAAKAGVEGVHVGWQGDETENVVNSYGNQPHTVELNRSAQLELDFDLRVWTIKEAMTLGVPISASSVISNHGEWTRNGGKEPVTSQNDNASTHIARQVEKLFREMEPFGGPAIDWSIGKGEPGVVVNLSGIGCYFSHGYIEKGRGGSSELRTRSAIERQILGKTGHLGDVPLWFMAHYHHFYSNEFEGRTLFGCPALEAERSSEYMLDQFGVWSPAGMLGMIVGAHLARGWEHLNVY